MGEESGRTDAGDGDDATGSQPHVDRADDATVEGSPAARTPEGSPLDLRLAWAEYRLHVAAATVLFVIGLFGGLAMAATGVDLLALLGYQDVEGLLPENFEPTVWFIFWNNTRVYVVLLLGALTLGLLPAVVLGFNGVVVGWVAGIATGNVGAGPVLALLVPHGIFELPALWLAAGISLRLVHLAVDDVWGERDHFLTRAAWKRTLLLVVVGWLLIGLASLIEVYVTPAIAEAIYGDVGSPVG